jgi:hypothetical protein
MTQDQVSLNIINLFKDLKEPDAVYDAASAADGNNTFIPPLLLSGSVWILSQVMDIPSEKLKLGKESMRL